MPRLLALMLLGWAIAFFGSFMMFYLTPARDFGFTAGWNKVSVFLTWQMVATVLALACLVMRWTSRDVITRRFALIPTVALGLLMAALAGLVLWANMQTGGAVEVPLHPVTTPVDR